MTEYLVFDELRLSFRVPADLDDAACEAIRQVLESQQFRVRLGQAIRQVVRQHPDLAPVRVRISG